MMDMRKLPDAEFELMQIIWQNPTPISTNQIISHLHNDWKPQTVLTLLTRLIERGFLKSERAGKERIYSPLVTREAYVSFESGSFMEKFHKGSFLSLVNTLYEGHRMTDEDIDALKKWLNDAEEKE